jgi:hypothetical protein
MHIDPEQRQGIAERRHVEQRQHIARHLRSLPQETRHPYDWMEFRRRARERVNAETRRRVNNRKYAVLAAAFVLVIVGVAAWIRATRSSTAASIANQDTFVSDTPASVRDESKTRSGVEERAAAAERWLASLPNEPIVVRVGTRAAVAGLEDRIAQLDDVLSAARVEGAQPAKLAALEEQRVRLVNSLVQVRYAETLVSASH